jgi:DNA-binding XRE family transcriptional regulator
MFRLQDRTALIADVRNKTLTLIEKEDDTMSWDIFLVYFSHNAMPT